MHIEKQQVTTYRWWTNDNIKISNSRVEELDNAATTRIREMQAEGYTSGELFVIINDDEYNGWWETTTNTVNCSQVLT